MRLFSNAGAYTLMGLMEEPGWFVEYETLFSTRLPVFFKSSLSSFAWFVFTQRILPSYSIRHTPLQMPLSLVNSCQLFFR